MEHNEPSLSEGKVNTFTHYHAFGQAFMLSFRVEVHIRIIP